MPPRMLFADTFYWVALLNPGDAYHARVKSLGSGLGTARLVTTDEVLTEVLNWFSRSGRHWRGEAAILIHDLRSDPDVARLRFCEGAGSLGVRRMCILPESVVRASCNGSGIRCPISLIPA